jgi:hypothetical protein
MGLCYHNRASNCGMFLATPFFFPFFPVMAAALSLRCEKDAAIYVVFMVIS